jgi:hypothetical protein
MNDQQQEILENLRNATQQDQWTLCRENLAKLLPDLEQTDSIKIIVKQAQRFLGDLARTHAEDENIGRAIEALNGVTSLEALDRQGQLIDLILDSYWNWPGVSNFRNAFKGISKPKQYFDHSGEYVDILVSIISNILIATETNRYWGDSPEF